MKHDYGEKFADLFRKATMTTFLLLLVVVTCVDDINFIFEIFR
jgi:hypothetical protein